MLPPFRIFMNSTEMALFNSCLPHQYQCGLEIRLSLSYYAAVLRYCSQRLKLLLPLQVGDETIHQALGLSRLVMTILKILS